MTVSAFLKSKVFNKLISKGKENNFLSPEQINDAIPASIVDPSEIDLILFKLVDNAIEIVIEVSEEDEEGIKFDGTEIIEETLSKEEKAELRSASTDPVKLYLKRKRKEIKEVEEEEDIVKPPFQL